MKAKLFFLLIAGFALSMLSCNGDPAGTSNDDNTAGTYGTTGSTHDPLVDPRYPDGKPDMGEPDETIPPPEYIPVLHSALVFSVDDIKSYNITTKEIVLTDIISKKLTTPNENDEGLYYMFNIMILYYNDEPLFEEIRISYPVDSNPWSGYIVLSVCGDCFDCPLFRLYKNAIEYQAEWDTFIKYLTDAGKIVE